MAQAGSKNIDNASGQVVRLDIENTIKTVATHNFGQRDQAGTIEPCEFLADSDTGKLLIRKSSGGNQADPTTGNAAAFFYPVGNLDEDNLGLLPKTGGTLTGVLQLPTGSVSAPALTVGDSGTGLFKPSSNVLGITADGTKKLTVNSTATEFSGNATDGAKIRLNEATNNGNSYIELRAADSISNNVVLTLPPADGTSGQAIITNGSGTLTFGAPTVGAADLTGNTLANGVTASSLTSVGTLSSLAVTGTCTAGTFSGSGASLTNIPAGNLTGTVADARITSLSASKLTGALPAINGSALTGIDTAFKFVIHDRQGSDFNRPTGTTSFGATGLDKTFTIPSNNCMFFFAYSLSFSKMSNNASMVRYRMRIIENGTSRDFIPEPGGLSSPFTVTLTENFKNEGGNRFYNANDTIRVVVEVRNGDVGTGNRTKINAGSFFTIFVVQKNTN